MTFLYVLLAILVLIVLLLSIKITLIADYDNELNIVIKWLFFKAKLYPPKEKKGKKKKGVKKTKKISKKKEKPNTLRRLLKEQGFKGAFNFLKDISKLLKHTVKKVLKRTIIKELFIDITVVAEDSAKTAIKYGEICSGAYSAIALLSSLMKVRKKDININTDFLANKTTVKFRLNVYIRPITIAFMSISLTLKIIFMILSQIKKSDKIKNKDK